MKPFPSFGLPPLALQPFNEAPQQPHNPMDRFTPEQLAQMFQPFDEQERAIQQQMAYAQALRNKPAPRHTTGIGGALGALGQMFDGMNSGLQQQQAKSAQEVLLKKKGEAEAQKFGLMQALEQQKAARAEALKREQYAQKLKADAAERERAEKTWQDHNAVTAKQALQRAHVMAGLQDKRADAAAERTAKKDAAKEDAKIKAQVVEIEEKSRNIQTELDKLDKLVDSAGTFELGGTETPEMESIIDTIAIDMSKLRDPGSVVRSEEKEGEKKALFSPGVKGLFTSNKTAKELIGKYRERVKQRRDEAYEVRGLTPPAAAKSASGVDLGADDDFTPEDEAAYQAWKKAQGL